MDSGNDGLNDRDELVNTNTQPHVKDSDGDGLSDFDEVVTYQGWFNPNKPDTDGDGQNDKFEAQQMTDPNGDYDQDGIKKSHEENTYGTDPMKADTDCDGRHRWRRIGALG